MKLNDLCRVAIVPCLALICTPLPILEVPDLSPVKSREITAHAPFVLAKDGVSAASICVMAPAPSPKLQKLVGELQTCIELTTGAKLPVLHGRIAEPAIVLGACPEAKARGLDGAEMPVDGFELKTTATCIYIVGKDAPVDSASGIVSNGTAWGAADFLERILGVRWYWALEADGRSVVKQSSVSIAPAWYADAPVFRHRDYWPEQFNPQVIFLRNGNSWPMQLRVHQPDWSQNAEYKKDRPEIYQMNPDGSRDFTTYCYTHPRTTLPSPRGRVPAAHRSVPWRPTPRHNRKGVHPSRRSPVPGP